MGSHPASIAANDAPGLGDDVRVSAASGPAATLGRAPLLAVPLVAAVLSAQVLVQALALGADASAAIADGLHALVDALVVGATIAIAIGIALPLAPRRALAATVGAAIVVGALGGTWLVEARHWSPAEVALADVLPTALRYALIVAIVALIVARRRAVAAAELREIDQRIAIERLALAQNEAQLALLRSQVEPHFLFNTLATIRRLQRTDPATGRDTLAGFIDYLCGALPLLGQRETTLGDEVDLAAAYLAVVRTRMGDRLSTSIDVPAELRRCAVPPFAVATLVENAVKHGLSMLREGGSLAIRARADADRVIIEVADTGVGLQGSGGTGTGLAHLQARLDVLHGTRACVRLRANHPSGAVAEIELPRRSAGVAP